MFLRKYWIPLSVLLIAMCAVSLYWIQTQPPKELIKIYKAVEPLPKSERQTEAPHGHFHAEPHETPVEQPSTTEQWESETPSAIVQGDLTSDPTQAPSELSARTPENQEAVEVLRKWNEWDKKYSELSYQLSQATKEMIAAVPATEEGREQFEKDPEMQRKFDEALHKSAKIDAMLDALIKEKPVRP